MLTKLFSNNSLPSLIMALLVSIILGVFLGNHFSTTPWLWFGAPVPLVPWVGFTTLIIVLPLSAWFFDLQLNRAALLPPNNFVTVCLASVACVMLLLANHPEAILLLLLLALAFGRLLQLAQSANSYWVLTDVGLFIGAGLCLNGHFIWLILFCWLAALFFGVLSFRSFFTPLLGAGLSYVLIASANYFIYDKFLVLTFNFQFTDFVFFTDALNHWWMLIPFILGILATLSTAFASVNKGKVTDRQTFGFLLVTFIITGILAVFLKNSIALSLTLCFPLAIFYANFLQKAKRWWIRDLVLISPWVTIVLLFLMR